MTLHWKGDDTSGPRVKADSYRAVPVTVEEPGSEAETPGAVVTGCGWRWRGQECQLQGL